MRSQGQPFVILSSDRPHMSPGLTEYHRTALAQSLTDRKLSHKGVVGVLEARPEVSQLVTLDAEHSQLGEVLRLAASYNQEAVLLVHGDRSAELIYLADHRREPAGVFKQVPAWRRLDDNAPRTISGGDTYVLETTP